MRYAGTRSASAAFSIQLGEVGSADIGDDSSFALATVAAVDDAIAADLADKADITFVESAIAAYRPPETVLVLTEDWLSGNVGASHDWAASVNGAGAAVNVNSIIVADGYGIAFLVAGTTSTGRAALSWETVSSQLPLTYPGSSGTMVLEYRVRIPILPTVSEDFRVSLSLGIGANVSGVDITGGVTLRCDSTNGTWIFASRNASADVTTVVTSSTVTTSWTYVRIEVDSVSARVYIGATKDTATLQGTILAASLTHTGAVGQLVKMRKTAGVTSRTLYLDYTTFVYTLATPR